MNSRISESILTMLLCVWAGVAYFALEIIWKIVGGHPERIHWAMLFVAIFLAFPLVKCGGEFPWNTPLTLQALVCAIIITLAELILGIVLNLWLKLNIWDYSALAFNILGQISLLYFIFWYILSIVFIPIFDWFVFAIKGGERPRYRIF